MTQARSAKPPRERVMNPQTLLELAPLPAAVTSLLDSFSSTHNCKDLKVWGRSGGDWVCVYPRGDVDYQEVPSTIRYPVDLPDGSELEIEVDGGSVRETDRKSTRLNSSHLVISYAVFCLK